MPSSPLVDVIGRAHERVFAAMGTHAHVVVVGPPELVDVAVRRVADLESRWSRFLPGSELTRLNAHAGRGDLAVTAETFALVARAVEGWRLSGGSYDPTVLPALVAAGYDRSFADPACGVHRGDAAAAGVPAPGAAAIALDARLRTVGLPAGVQLDPGGIGKGMAADMVVAELLAAGAQGACVNLGGDIRVGGRAPTAHGWVLGLDDPLTTGGVVPVRLHDEAMVTSTRRIRRWVRGGRSFHHLIDPRTGLPARSALHTATVVAPQAWWAEVLAKVALVAPEPQAVRTLDRARVAALLADEEGRALELGSWTARIVGPM